MTIRGSIDGLSSEGVFGWAFPDTGGPLLLHALLDGRILGEALADQHRHDLASAGFGDGRCGFTISFYEKLSPALLPFVTVKPAGGDVELPRTNLSGFVEFFRAIHARHPGAGRSRSVFGGLWTDRTDALPVLDGRIASGATPANLRGGLTALISHGYAVLRQAVALAALPAAEAVFVVDLPTDRPLNPRASEAERRAVEALPGIIFREPALHLLCGALDDQPVCFRAALSRTAQDVFTQPSAAEALPSPAECLALVAGLGGEVAVDLIRGSHALPEFTGDGRNRFLPDGPAAALELAQQHGASVETVQLERGDLLLLGPGTLYRLRAAEGASALCAWIAPRRVTPSRFLTEAGQGTFVLRHRSGAALAA